MSIDTTYLGLNLRSPIVASASPLSHKLDNVKRLEDAGAGAVVFYSLFQEQVQYERFLSPDPAAGEIRDAYPEALRHMGDGG